MPRFPRTIQHDLPYVAAVIFFDGDSKVCCLKSEDEANDWIDRKIHMYGGAIVATDIYPNTN